jgi:hypothetical protein
MTYFYQNIIYIKIFKNTFKIIVILINIILQNLTILVFNQKKLIASNI